MSKLTMSHDCKHAQHRKCESKDCWCACHGMEPLTSEGRLRQALIEAEFTATKLCESGDWPMSDETNYQIQAMRDDIRDALTREGIQW